MVSKLNYPQIGLLILAWFIADLLTPLIIRLCHRIGAVDRPHSYKIHKDAVPFLGGVAIYVSFSIALFSILRFSGYEENKALFSIIFGGSLVVLVGAIDDFRPLSAVIKLLILFVVTWFLARFGVRIEMSGLFWVDLLLTLIWIAGVTSSVNSMDNMDGAAAGIGAIAALATALVAFYSYPFGQPGVSYVAITLFGACLGFLRYNFRPARIFLGDNGSLLLGFLLASLMVLTGWAQDDKFKAIIIPCSILVVPLYDITLSTILRIRSGAVSGIVEAIVYCGQDHLSHRLVAMGLSQQMAVITMYAFGVIGGCLGFVISRPEVTPDIYIPITGVSFLILILFGVYLNKANVHSEKNAKSV